MAGLCRESVPSCGGWSDPSFEKDLRSSPVSSYRPNRLRLLLQLQPGYQIPMCPFNLEPISEWPSMRVFFNVWIATGRLDV
eukprot:3704755-Amphidinium_carterae.1